MAHKHLATITILILLISSSAFASIGGAKIGGAYIGYVSAVTPSAPANSRDFEQSSTQYASITDASGPNLNLGGGNTVFYACGWIKPESFNNQMSLIGKQASNLDAGYQYEILILNNPTKKLNFTKAYGTTDYATVTENTFGALSAGTTYFWEAYNDGTNMGVSISPSDPTGASSRTADTTTADTNTFRASTGKFWMATRGGVAGAPDTGVLYDGAMQSTTFILGMPTTGERNAFYNGGKGVWNTTRPSLSTATYVSFWEQGESSGSDMTDSVSGYTLTQSGTVGTASALVS